MILILAEKYKAARRIAHILSGGSFRTLRLGSHIAFSWGSFLVVPLQGHILDVDFPKEYSRWSLSRLKELIWAPLVRKVRNKKIFSALKRLRGVKTVIIATDADREGEAIGLEVARELFRDVPTRRAWFSSLTREEIKRAFNNLIEPKYGLAEAAFTRRDVDLLWGAVLTRALSLTAGRRGKSFLSVGRVQTPTLALVVEKEREIRAFRPKTFFVLKIVAGGLEAEHPRHFEDRAQAEEAAKRVAKQARVARLKREKKHIPRPVPFDTTTFLSEANKILGLSPKKALDIAEDLYMSGLVSYPRTDNQTYTAVDRELLLRLARLYGLDPDRLTQPSHGRRTEDHPPIHPVSLPSRLEGDHERVYDLITRRFLATFLPPAQLEFVEVELDAGLTFIARGRRLLDPGWTIIYPYTVEERLLPPLSPGDELPVETVRIERRKTSPPPRYTPATLVKRMESLGLGTKATRAEIIEKLYKRGYIKGKKSIRPTELGELVYDLLKELAPQALEPSLTAMLEQEMDRVERGERDRDQVVEEARKALERLVDNFLSKKDHIRQVFERGDRV